MATELEQMAELMVRMAVELEEAAKHAHVASSHARDREVPRFAAHAFAASGHMVNARELLEEAMRVHASKAKPVMG